MLKKTKLEILDEITELEGECNSLLDAIVVVCEKYNIEMEVISQYIKNSKEIKSRLRDEGLSLNLLKKQK